MILLSMFLVTQIIGLAVINAYTPRYETAVIDGVETNITINPLPYGMQPPEVPKGTSLVSIIIAFALAILIIFLLTKFRAKWFLKIWFFSVVTLALGITLYALLFYIGIPYAALIALLIALPLAIFKIFKQHLLVHNLTELMVYPGIAAVFVPILNFWTIIILLIAISAYDIWAVWHTGFMQKMAKYQINHLKLFAGFFVPHMSKKQREKVRAIKQKYKNKKIPEKEIRKKKIKVSLAILGGGDVIFPIIAAGIFLRTFGLLQAGLITIGATIALFALFIAAKKGKYYPAMPFISAGIFMGMLIGWLI